jgi:hypothetical protein
MNTTPLSLEALQALPKAIWMPGHPPSIYRGSPLEMVHAMAKEMESSDLSVRETIQAILSGLLMNRRLFIALPNVKSDETLARLFVYALLGTGVGRKIPTA